MFYVKLDTNEFIVVQLITEFTHNNIPHLLYMPTTLLLHQLTV